MAMTVGEANAVNILIRAALDEPGAGDADQLAAALTLLAGSAHRTLAAGLRPESVTDILTAQAEKRTGIYSPGRVRARTRRRSA